MTSTCEPAEDQEDVSQSSGTRSLGLNPPTPPLATAALQTAQPTSNTWLHGDPESVEDTSIWRLKTVFVLDGDFASGRVLLEVLCALMSKIELAEQVRRRRDGLEQITAASNTFEADHRTSVCLEQQTSTNKIEQDPVLHEPPESGSDLPELLIRTYVRRWRRHIVPVSKGRQPRPCDYFDYITGQGPAGIAAIMLGRLRMSADAALEQYTKLNDCFYDDIRHRRRYRTSRLRAAVKDMIRNELAAKPKAPRFKTNDAVCKTWLVAPEPKCQETPIMLRSYLMDWESEHEAKLSILQACDMLLARGTQRRRTRTSSIPSGLGPRGGDELLSLARQGLKWEWADRNVPNVMVGVRNLKTDSKLHVQLSTSWISDAAGSTKEPIQTVEAGLQEIQPRHNRDSDGQGSVSSSTLPKDDIATDSDSRKVGFKNRLRKSLNRQSKALVAPSSRTATDSSDTSNTNSDILSGVTTSPLTYDVSSFIQKPSVQEKLTAIAELLVAIRARRSKTPHWSAFAGQRFTCPAQDCKQQQYIHLTKVDALDHICDNHFDMVRTVERYNEVLKKLEGSMRTM